MSKNAKVSPCITDIPSLYTGYAKVWWNFECTPPGATQKERRDRIETRIRVIAANSSMIEVFQLHSDFCTLSNHCAVADANCILRTL